MCDAPGKEPANAIARESPEFPGQSRAKVRSPAEQRGYCVIVSIEQPGSCAVRRSAAAALFSEDRIVRAILPQDGEHGALGFQIAPAFVQAIEICPEASPDDGSGGLNVGDGNFRVGHRAPLEPLALLEPVEPC